MYSGNYANMTIANLKLTFSANLSVSEGILLK